MNIGVILAAGASERFQSSIHKQYLKLNGKEVIYYSINSMRTSQCFEKIIAVVDKDECKRGYVAEKFKIECIEGGDTRNKSIKNALDYIKNNYQATKVVFHDCARPFINTSIFKKCVDLLDCNSGVAMSTEITDSLVTREGEFVNRKEFSLIQTPEAFIFNTIYNDFDPEKKDTAIINQLKEKSKIFLLKDPTFNFKITYPEDLFLAEQLMRINYFRTYKNHFGETSITGKVLLLGGGGGVGQAIKKYLDQKGIVYYSPSHTEMDLRTITVAELSNKCPFLPDIIINVAAAYANDNVGLLETFDEIFDVNLKANLVLIEYSKILNKRVNIVLMSSSSSTRGRENLTNYSAAKAALNSIVESQGQILHEIGIYLNAIIPEKINTPLIGKLHTEKIDISELLEVSDVIQAIVEYSQTNEYGKLVHVRKGL